MARRGELGGTRTAMHRCGTCKHYEAAPMWKKGWCRNPLLYSPQQSHLVAEDDLDCNRGMGSYWEPIEGELADEAPFVPLVPPAPSTTRFAAPPPRTIAPANPGPASPTSPQRPAPRREPVGPIARPQARPEASRRQQPRPGRPPVARQPLESDSPDGYAAADERARGDYLRRIYPAIGIILLLGAFWVGSSAYLARRADTGETEPAVAVPANPATAQVTVIVPSPTVASAAGPAPTPTLPTPPPGVVAPGARVVVSTAGDGANIRQEPSLSAPTVTAVANGTVLTITGESREADDYTWWPVSGEGVSGWVAGALIEPAP